METKRCSKCGDTKSLDRFANHSKTRDGKKSGCRDCQTNQIKQRYHNDPELREAQRRRQRVRKYGLSPEQFQQMLIQQNYGCAICLNPFTRTPNVDHDHGTAVVRGLLCSPCNSFLGRIGDSVAALQRTILYLESHYED